MYIFFQYYQGYRVTAGQSEFRLKSKIVFVYNDMTDILLNLLFLNNKSSCNLKFSDKYVHFFFHYYNRYFEFIDVGNK